MKINLSIKIKDMLKAKRAFIPQDCARSILRVYYALFASPGRRGLGTNLPGKWLRDQSRHARMRDNMSEGVIATIYMILFLNDAVFCREL
jgi:hypothetical protein